MILNQPSPELARLSAEGADIAAKMMAEIALKFANNNNDGDAWALTGMLAVVTEIIGVLITDAGTAAIFDGSIPEEIRGLLFPGEFKVGSEGLIYEINR
jgi:hypothetical protein